jgi:hypothetical protein
MRFPSRLLSLKMGSIEGRDNFEMLVAADKLLEKTSTVLCGTIRSRHGLLETVSSWDTSIGLL